MEGRNELEVACEKRVGLSQDAFDDGRGIEVGRWIGGGGAVSWAGASSVAGCLVRAAVPFEGASLEHIPIRGLSKRCRFFRAQEMSSGERPNWEWSLWTFFLRVSV